MYKLAITSSGPLSGKTTLAKYLEAEHGFIRADHSRTLVEWFVQTWNDPLPHIAQITVEQVYQDKETYRPLLQQYGDMIGFNDPGRAAHWILRTINRTISLDERGVVFDSFRGEKQAQVLRDLGFTLVQLEISETERKYRAGLMGKDYFTILAAMEARPDLELGIDNPDIRLDGSIPLQIQVQILFQAGKTYGPYPSRC